MTTLVDIPLFSHADWLPAPRKKERAPRPAAGVLLRYTDAEGEWYLLGKRHKHLGGTWSNLGGSLKDGEDPLAGALREFFEEIGVGAATLTTGAMISRTIDCGTDKVPYTLYVIDTPVCFDNATLNWEHSDLLWIPAEDVATYKLHPGFARAWATLNDQKVNACSTI